MTRNMTRNIIWNSKKNNNQFILFFFSFEYDTSIHE